MTTAEKKKTSSKQVELPAPVVPSFPILVNKNRTASSVRAGTDFAANGVTGEIPPTRENLWVETICDGEVVCTYGVSRWDSRSA